MIVVADSSPFIVLINIGSVEILPKLFGQVIIPPEVSAEMQRSNRPEIVRTYIAIPPPWLIQRAPTAPETIALLDPGEAAAISLAMELRADVLLIDEALGRKVAASRHLPVTGTIGVLELAARQGLLDLKDAFERVKKTDFWISHEFLDERLKLHKTNQP